MKTTIKTITPDWAKKILETRNTKNRRLSERFVQKLAQDIKAGAFLTTHQGLAFDDAGNLLDGQHRLAAVVLAMKPVQMMVTTGIPAAHKLNGTKLQTFEVIDTGAKRATGDMLQMAGFINANRLAACIRCLVNCCSEYFGNQAVSTAQTHKAIELIGDSAEVCVGIASQHRMFNATGYITAACTLYHTVKPEAAEVFLAEVGDISGGMNSPSRALVTWSRRHPMTGGQAAAAGFKTAASAIQATEEGRTLQKVYSSDTAAKWLLGLNKPLVDKLASLLRL